MSSQFEWDAEKDRVNREKHGISFEEASVIFSGRLLTASDNRQDYGEKRFISYGQPSRVGHHRRSSHQPLRANPADLGPQGQLQREEGIL